MNKQSIHLKELINRVRDELLEKHDEANPLFVIGQVELEISFTVERTVNGGIDLQVVQAGADRKTTEVQVVKVTLEPVVEADEIRAGLTNEQRQKAASAVRRSFNDPSAADNQSR